uniref:Ferritin/DPS protein domain-containing protein n=1 Tax=Panagrolaimus davidi TaxID=227884 RepID=A0A914PXC3_9BILA
MEAFKETMGLKTAPKTQSPYLTFISKKSPYRILLMNVKMAHYFRRDDVALRNVFEFFNNDSDLKCYKAERLMQYMNKRGGDILWDDISAPPKMKWGSLRNAFEEALEMEKELHKEVLAVHTIAAKNEDYNHSRTWLGNLQRITDGVGEFIFDMNYFCELNKKMEAQIKMHELKLNE